MSSEAASDTTDPADESAQRFSLVVGGPFNALLGRCGLLEADGLPSQQAALGIALLAWLLPGVLAIVQTLLDPSYHGVKYFEDYSTLARLFIAIGIMLATERLADQRLGQLIREFWQSRVIAGEARKSFFEVVRATDRASSSALAQALILAIALVAAGRTTDFDLAVEQMGWEGREVTTGAVLSWAGLAARWFSIPVFQFLVMMWLWRLVVWTQLLFRISRLPLQLVPLHPDRVAGLGFLGVFPGIFRGFVFALSCVVASLLLKDLQADAGHSVELLRKLAIVWVGCVLVLFVAPLCVFYVPLYELRERELGGNARRVNHWFREFHERWIDGNEDAPVDPRSRPSLGDLNSAIETLQGMRAVPIDRAAVIQLLVAALAPLVVVGATQIPLKQMLGNIMGFVI